MKKVNALVALAVASTLYGCSASDSSPTGGGETTSGSVRLSGAIGTSYQAASKADGSRLATLEGAVDAVWAVPVNSHGSSTFADFDYAVTADVQADGSFELSLPEEKDFVLLLMNTAAPDRRDQIVSYVSLADTTSTLSLLYLPISEADVTDIDLGTVEEDTTSGEAQSETALDDSTAASFTLTLDQLLELASVDDTFKAIKNQFVNHPATGTYYDLNLGFSWFINYGFLATNDKFVFDPPLAESTLPASHPMNVNLQPDGWYSGYSLQVNTNRDLSVDNVCPPTGEYWATVPADGKLLGIYPPATLDPQLAPVHSALSVTYNTTTPIANNGDNYTSGSGVGLGSHHYDTGCMDADMALTTEEIGGETQWRFGLWGDDYLEGAVPAGEWVVKLDGTELAWFDVAASYPFDASGNPVVYIPVPTIETDDVTKEVTAITIGWVRWNGTEYVAADPAAAEMVAGNFMAGVTDDSVGDPATSDPAVRVEGYVRGDTLPTSLNLADIEAPGTGSLLDTNNPWYFDPTGSLDGERATDAYHIETFSVGYSMGGVDYHFAYRNRPAP